MIGRAEIESALRRAILADEIEAHFQPIIDLRSGRIMGAEALARWTHPEMGSISPAEFIPIAEETALIVPLGRRILENACLEAHNWQNKTLDGCAISVTVNISSRQFQDDSLFDSVVAALAISGLEPQNLVLEITEKTMLQDTPAAIEKTALLKDIGVRLAIDDFGTGYSSLSYLQRFPIDILKIDKPFIDRICDGGPDAALTRAIIILGHLFNLKTLAEGIESREQADVLQDLGCDLGQGYHFARPLTPEKISDFILGKGLAGNDETVSSIPAYLSKSDICATIA